MSNLKCFKDYLYNWSYHILEVCFGWESTSQMDSSLIEFLFLWNCDIRRFGIDGNDVVGNCDYEFGNLNCDVRYIGTIFRFG